MPVVKTTSPAWDRALPNDQPENSDPSSRTIFAAFVIPLIMPFFAVAFVVVSVFIIDSALYTFY
jgi:hypothetical protein